jgi:hypothetical protein
MTWRGEIQPKKSPPVVTDGGPTWRGNEVRHTFGDDGFRKPKQTRESMAALSIMSAGFCQR